MAAPRCRVTNSVIEAMVAWYNHLRGLPFTLHSATRNINEWQPTTFMPYFTWGLVALVAMQVVAWVRTTERVPRAEMLWTGALVACLARHFCPTIQIC